MRYSGILICSIIPGIVSVLNIHNNAYSFSVPAPITYYQNKADSADMIINKYLDAIGGKEKWESIHTLYMEGSLLVRGQKIASKTWIVNNTATRNESILTDLPSGALFMPIQPGLIIRGADKKPLNPGLKTR